MLLALVLLPSCHEGLSNPDEAALAIYFVPSGAERQSHEVRATETGEDAANENKVEQVAVTFLNQDGSHDWTPTAAEYTLASGVVTIRKPLLAQHLTNGTTYRILLFANLPSSIDISGKSQSELAQLVHTFADLKTASNGTQARASLPMWGEVTAYQHSAQPTTLGAVQLQRHFAKIRVKVYSQRGFIQQHLPSEDGFWGVPQVKLLRGNCRATLLPTPQIPSESFDSPSAITLLQKGSDSDGPFVTHQLPLYSTPIQWSGASQQRASLNAPHILIALPLYMGGTPASATHADATWYYYTTPVVDPDMEQALKGNHLYELLVNIDAPGSTEAQAPVPITGQVQVKPWESEGPIEVDLQDAADYFHIAPAVAELYGTEFRFKYTSSKPVDASVVQRVDQEYTTFKAVSGDPIPHPEMDYKGAEITLDTAKGELIFRHPLPENNAPHKYTIYLKTTWMSEPRKVVLTQYPALVVRGVQSQDGGSPNPTLFIFRFPQSQPPKDTSIDYKLGYPDAANPSADDARIVSPHFMVASYANGDKGVSPINSYEKARAFCENYVERAEGVTYTNWRLPTRAELEIMNAITRKSDGITSGEQIILNRNTNQYWALDGSHPGPGNRVRPVHDLK